MYVKLLRLFFKENLSLKRLLGFDLKENKVKAILIGLAILYALVAFIGGFGFLFYDLGKILSEIGQERVLLGFMSVYTLGISVMLVLLRSNGYLFHYKDYEILSPLPIHPRTVLLAKMSVMMVMLYISSFLISLPILFSYFFWNGFNLISILFLIIGLIFLPLIPVVILSFVSLAIAYLTSKIPGSKIISIILMFVFFLGIFMLSFSMNDVEQNPLTGQIELFAGIIRIYPPLQWFMTAIHERSILDLLYLVIANGMIFGLYVFGIQGLVQKTNQRGVRTYTRKAGSKINYQSSPIGWTIVKKEFKKFFSIPLYALNSGLGPVLLLIAGIASLFYMNELEEILTQMAGAELPIEMLIIMLLGFSISMTYTSAISLSFEGKNLWIIKSLPIPPVTVMFSKILFNVLLVLPIAILSILMFGISIRIGFVNQILLIILASLFSFLTSTVNGIINLYMPKFNYTNDVEVIKQSAGALLGVFGGFGLMAINGFSIYLLIDLISMTQVLMILSLLNLVLLGLAVWVIKTQTDKVFRTYKA